MDVTLVPAFVMSTTVVSSQKCAVRVDFVVRQELTVIPLMDNWAAAKSVRSAPKLRTNARALAIARVPMIAIVVPLVIRASAIRLAQLAAVAQVGAVEAVDPGLELELVSPLVLLLWSHLPPKYLPLAYHRPSFKLLSLPPLFKLLLPPPAPPKLVASTPAQAPVLPALGLIQGYVPWEMSKVSLFSQSLGSLRPSCYEATNTILAYYHTPLGFPFICRWILLFIECLLLVTMLIIVTKHVP